MRITFFNFYFPAKNSTIIFCKAEKDFYLCSPKKAASCETVLQRCHLIHTKMDAIKLVQDTFAKEAAAKFPEFKAGDTITVTYRIKEGDKDRLQKFRGVVIQIKGGSPFTRTFTVRKIASGVGVERIFPYESPFIDSIELNKVGKVRRARIFYIRDLAGKKARIKEAKRAVKETEE